MNLNAANNIDLNNITVKAQLIKRENLLMAAEIIISNQYSLSAAKELKAA